MGYTFHNAFPEEVVRLIGVVAIEGAYFDYMVGAVLARIKGEPEDIVLNEDFGRDTRKKLSDIEDFRDRLPEAIARVLDASKEILRDRNFAIHGITFYRGESDDLSTLERFDTAMRGHYKNGKSDRSVAWLKDLIEKIADANKLMIDALEPSASLGKL